MSGVINVLQPVFAVLGAVAAIVTIVTVLSQVFGRRVTWNNARRAAWHVLREVQRYGWRPDMVIGIGRSGGIWGGWLAGNLGSLPFIAVDDHYSNGQNITIEFNSARELLLAVREGFPQAKRFLAIEGASSTGRSFEEFRKIFDSVMSPRELRLATLYKNPTNPLHIDYVGEVGPSRWPNRFPWHETDAYRPFLRNESSHR